MIILLYVLVAGVSYYLGWSQSVSKKTLVSAYKLGWTDCVKAFERLVKEDRTKHVEKVRGTDAGRSA